MKTRRALFVPSTEFGLVVTLTLMLIVIASPALAQMRPTGTAAASPYSDLFEIAKPGYFGVTAFGGGYRSDKYATTEEGFQFEQSITRYVGLVGRMTAYQLYVGEGFDDPLSPGKGHSARLNFGRFQGGLDLTLYPRTHLLVFGGKDVGDSHAPVIEGDFSSWMRVYSAHPVNFAFEAGHDYQNGVTSSEINLRTVAFSGEKFMFLVGGGGALYGGGFVSSVQGQGGPLFGVYIYPWAAALDAEAGYGSAGIYGQVTVFKVAGWTE